MHRRAYVYTRFSTDEQKHGDSLQRQIELAETYASRNDLRIVARYEDLGVSAFLGKNLTEGELGRLLGDVRTGKVMAGSVLLVEAFDRLSREDPVSAFMTVGYLLKSGISIVTTADGQEHRHGSGDLSQLFGMMMKMGTANHESKQKSERVRSAWEKKRQRAAEQKLTAMVPAWLTLDREKNTFLVQDDTASTVKRIFRESAAGLGSRIIARRLNADGIKTLSAAHRRKGASKSWASRSVKHILTSESVIGRYQPKARGDRRPLGEPIEGYYPAIVPLADYYASQVAYAGRKAGSGGQKGNSFPNLFGKVAVCARCGSPMNVLNTGKRGGRYIKCSGAKKGICDMTAGWRYEDFERSFLTFMRGLNPAEILGNDEADQKLAAIKKTVEHVEALIANLLERANRIAAALETGGDMATLVSRLKELESQIDGARIDRQRLSDEFVAEHAKIKHTAGSRSLVARMLDETYPAGELLIARSRCAQAIKAVCQKIVVNTIGDDDPRQRSMIVYTHDQGAVMISPDPNDSAKLRMFGDWSESQLWRPGSYREITMRVGDASVPVLEHL